MASPAFAAVASRRARFLLHARVSTPSVALEDIAEGVVCASLCVEASERAFFYFRPQTLGRFNFPLTNRWLGFPHPRRLLWSAKCPSRGMPRVLRMIT